MKEVYAIILFRPSVANPARKGSEYIEKKLIKAGRNNLTKDEYDRLSVSAPYKRHLEKKAIEELKIGVSDDNKDDLENLKDLNQTKALKAIAVEQDVNRLKKWLSKEPDNQNRVKVINAINTQIKMIESGEL